jgi:threonine 3-dehydrogenase
MRALRKTRPGPGAEIAEIPLPEPGVGQILLRVHATSICGTDLHIYEWNDWAANRLELPITFGHEVAGTVESTGPEVHHLEPGTFVAAETHIACGYCRTCRSGRRHICENLRILGVDTDGAFAEFVSIPAVNAWTVGEHIPPDVGSLMEPFGNAVHAAFGTSGDGADLVTGSVVVLGCGPIGLFCVGIARAAGARTVIAVEPNPFRIDLAKRMGADVVIDPNAEDAVTAVLEATRGSGAEVVLEMSGNPAAIDGGTRMLSRGGRMALLGLPEGPVPLDLNDQVIFKEARLEGITGREMFTTWQQTSTFLSAGLVDVAPVITHRFSLEDHAKAFEVMASGRSGKILLTPRRGDDTS